MALRTVPAFLGKGHEGGQEVSRTAQLSAALIAGKVSFPQRRFLD